MDCKYGACFIFRVRSVLVTCIAGSAACGSDVESDVIMGYVTFTAHVTVHIRYRTCHSPEPDQSSQFLPISLIEDLR